WIAMNGDNDLAGAAQHLKRALALDPVDLDVLRNGASLLESLGRLDEALAIDEAVVRRDPVNVNTFSNLGLYQRMAGRFDTAIEYGDPGLAEIVTDNLFDKIRADPRWLPFLRKIGKAPAQLAKIEFKVTPPQ